MRQSLALCAVAMASVLGSPAQAASPLEPMNYLVGNWSCTFDMNGQAQTYKAKWAYAVDGSWLRETDTWPGGGDVGMFGFAPQTHQWRWVVTDSSGGVTVFATSKPGTARFAFRSVYPDTSMSDDLARVSNVKYTIHFLQIANGKATRSSDVCTKI